MLVQCFWKVLRLHLPYTLIFGHNVLTLEHMITCIICFIKLEVSLSLEWIILCLLQFREVSGKKSLQMMPIIAQQGLLIHTIGMHHHLYSNKTYHILHLLKCFVKSCIHYGSRGGFQHLHHPLLRRLGILHVNSYRQGPLVS